MIERACGFFAGSPRAALPGKASMSRRLPGLVAILVVLAARPAAAQTNGQLWGNITLDWVRSEKLTYELDLEPKVLVVAPSTEPGWRNLDVTPNVEYAARPWLDLIGELGTGFTHQTDDVNSIEVTPRAGIRLHLLSRDQPRVIHVRELPPRRRVVLRDRLLVESRNTFYTGAGSGRAAEPLLSVRAVNTRSCGLRLHAERQSGVAKDRECPVLAVAYASLRGAEPPAADCSPRRRHALRPTKAAPVAKSSRVAGSGTGALSERPNWKLKADD